MTRLAAPARRRFLLAALTGCSALGITVSLAACATPIFPFIPSHYTFSQQQVQDAVQRKFPYQRTVSQVFDVALTNPVVGFLPDRNRVTVKLDARLRDAVHAAAGQRRVHAVERTRLRRRQPISRAQVADCRQFVSVTGRRRQYNQQINAAGALLATQLLDRYPIYTFKPEQLQFAGVNYEPGTITILTNGIRVQIVEK